MLVLPNDSLSDVLLYDLPSNVTLLTNYTVYGPEPILANLNTTCGSWLLDSSNVSATLVVTTPVDSTCAITAGSRPLWPINVESSSKFYESTVVFEVSVYVGDPVTYALKVRYLVLTQLSFIAHTVWIFHLLTNLLWSFATGQILDPNYVSSRDNRGVISSKNSSKELSLMAEDFRHDIATAHTLL